MLRTQRFLLTALTFIWHYCPTLQAIAAEDKDCRVLNLASGAGLHAMMALRAG